MTDDKTLHIEHTFRAPAEAVFEALTSEEVLRRWWHAEHDWETTEAEVDPEGHGPGSGPSYPQRLCPCAASATPVRLTDARSGEPSLMGFLDRLLGRDEPRTTEASRAKSGSGELTDEQAVERYRYLVRTAPPDRLEEAHEEAFARLTPEQRSQALRELSASVPEGERPDGEDPRSLARMATRAELREPGSVERALGRGGIGAGIGVTLLGSFAAAFAGTIVAQSLMDELGSEGEGGRGAEPEGGGDTGDAGGGGGDFGGGGFGGGDFGGGGDAGGGF